MRNRLEGRYPNIERWMKQHHVNKKQLAEKLGVNEKTVFILFSGRYKRGPGMYLRSAIERVTGMTYKEAFKEADD